MPSGPYPWFLMTEDCCDIHTIRAIGSLLSLSRNGGDVVGLSLLQTIPGIMSDVQSGEVWPQLPCATDKHETLHPRRSQSFNKHQAWPTLLIIFSIIITSFCSSANAAHITAPDLASFAHSEVLLVDIRPNFHSTHDQLRRRENSEKSTIKATPTVSSTLASTTTNAVTTTAASALTLPSPFDSSLGNNFTDSSCPKFIDEFISTDIFKSCSPFSLLLQTSTSFFKAQKSPLLLTETLDASCSANVTFCAAYLNTVANNLTSQANCKDDFDLGNPTVIEARNGLLAYKTLYQASCLHNPTTAAYCAVDAFTNASSPTDSYVYYLPLGTTLPGGTTPTCNACLENTMAVYQKASANRTQPIFQTYASAATMVNMLCGPTFTNASVPAIVSTSGARMNSGIGSGDGVGALVLVVAVALWLF